MNEIQNIEEKLIKITFDSFDEIKIMVSLFLKKKKNYSIFIRLLLSCFIASPEKIEILCLFIEKSLSFNCIKDQKQFFTEFVFQIINGISNSREIKFAANYMIENRMIPTDIIERIKPHIIYEFREYLAIDGDKVHIDKEFHENQIKKGTSPSLIVEYVRKDDSQSLIGYLNKMKPEFIQNYTIEQNPYERCEDIINKKCSLIDSAAYFGSIKCFKYLVVNNFKITSSTFAFAVMGGNVEIIHIVQEKLNKSVLEIIKGNLFYVLSCSIKYHRIEIFEWLLDQIKPIENNLIQMLTLICSSYSNYIIFNDFFLANIDFSSLLNIYKDKQIFDWIITDKVFKIKRQVFSDQQIYVKYKSIISQLFYEVIQNKQLPCLKVIVNNSPFIGDLMNHQFIDIIIKEYEKKNSKIIHYLLYCNAFDINMKGKLRRPEHFSYLKYLDQSKSLLLYSCDSNLTDLIVELLNIDLIDINTECKDDDFKIRNAFDSACENCSEKIVNLFISRFHDKIYINLPLHFSSRNRNIDNFKFLISNLKIDINQVDNVGRTCLHYSCEINNDEFVKILLKLPNININFLDQNKNTPFFTALKNCSIDCVKYLINFYNINDADVANKDTPLHIATKLNNLEMIKYILPNKNIDINKQNNDGVLYYFNNTPLHIACENGIINLVNIFIYHGSININIKNMNGVLYEIIFMIRLYI